MKGKRKLFISAKPEEYKKIWEDFNKVINGKFIFKEKIYANVNGPVFKFELLKKFEKIEFRIDQAIIIRPFRDDLFKPIIFRIDKESVSAINLNLWIKDWSDKLFVSNKIKTGDKNFDKHYALVGNDKGKIIGLFSNEIIRKGFIKDKSLIFKIKTENNKTVFELKKSGFIPEVSDLMNLYNFYVELIKESVNQRIL